MNTSRFRLIAQILICIFTYLGASQSFAGNFFHINLEDGSTANSKDSLGTPFFIAGGLNGTATIITNSGYFLTALHNIRSCISENNFRSDLPKGFREQFYVEGVSAEDADRFIGFHLDKEFIKNHKILCRRGQFKQNGYKAELIAVGSLSGWLQDWNAQELKTNYPEVFQRYRDLGYDGVMDIGDFALLKLVENEPEVIAKSKLKSPFNCLKLSSEPITPGQTVWNFSFPAKYSYDPKISAGFVYGYENHPSFLSTDLFKFFDSRVMYSSTDVAPGVSGSALFDRKGEIRGLVYAGVSQRSSYLRGNSAFIPSSYIVERLKDELGSEFVEKEILNGCSVNDKTQEYIDTLLTLPPL